MPSSYAETKAAELVAAMYSPKLKEPLKTKLGDAALAVIHEVIEDCVSVAKPLGWIGNREELRQHFYRALAGPTPTVKT